MNILKSDVYLTIHLKEADSLSHTCCVNALPLCHENTENFWGDSRPCGFEHCGRTSLIVPKHGVGDGGISAIVLAGIRQFFASAHVYLPLAAVWRNLQATGSFFHNLRWWSELLFFLRRRILFEISFWVCITESARSQEEYVTKTVEHQSFNLEGLTCIEISVWNLHLCLASNTN